MPKPQVMPMSQVPRVAPPESKVFIIVTSLNAHIHAELVGRLITWARRGAFISCILGVSPVDHARNEAVRTFIKPEFGNYTHFMFVDDDTIPPPDAVSKLLALNADIATGVTPIMRKDEENKIYTTTNCFTSIENDGEFINMETVEENSGIHEVLRCGASCLMLSRKAIETIGDPWFKITWTPDFKSYVGEDLSFCDLARSKGLKIVCDSSVSCAHFKHIML